MVALNSSCSWLDDLADDIRENENDRGANHLYSVAALTDNSGNVVERYRYDAYGQRTVLAADGVTTRTSSLYGNQVGFTGRYLDKETGLWYFRARYYSGSLGRFVSADPWRSTTKDSGQQYRPYPRDGYPSGMNTYAAYFVPNKTDPTGMWPGCDWGDCDSGNACNLGGMTGACAWFQRLDGARGCGCKDAPTDWWNVIVTCTCVLGVAAVIVVGVVTAPVTVPAAAACAAVGAAVLIIQATPAPCPSPSQCRPGGGEA